MKHQPDPEAYERAINGTQTPKELREERQQTRKHVAEAKQLNPAFWRALCGLSDRELGRLKIVVWGQLISQLRRAPNFDRDLSLQRRVHGLEYELSLAEYLERLRARRKPIVRYRPGNQTPAEAPASVACHPEAKPRPQLPPPLETVSAASAADLQPSAPVTPEPLPDNVLDLSQFRSKFFHSGNDTKSVW